MTYTIGDSIDASDFNQLASEVNSVMGVGSGTFGYGVSTLSTVAPASTVRAGEWAAFRGNIDDAAVHQGTDVAAIASAVLPPASAFEIGDLIIAYDGDIGRHNLPALSDDVVTNRADIAGSQSFVTASVLSSKRQATWNVQLVHEFTATFASADSARHFFNAGGEIRIRASRSGGASNAKNTDWTNLLSNAGTYTFDASVYFNPNANTALVQRNTAGGASAYAANDWTIFERRIDNIDGSAVRGSQGRVVRFRVEFNDDAAEGVDELVSGNIFNVVDHKSSTGRVVPAVPTYATITALTAGS